MMKVDFKEKQIIIESGDKGGELIQLIKEHKLEDFEIVLNNIKITIPTDPKPCSPYTDPCLDYPQIIYNLPVK